MRVPYACTGIVSKRIDLPYRSGPFSGWRKIKGPGYFRATALGTDVFVSR